MKTKLFKLEPAPQYSLALVASKRPSRRGTLIIQPIDPIYFMSEYEVKNNLILIKKENIVNAINKSLNEDKFKFDFDNHASIWKSILTILTIPSQTSEFIVGQHPDFINNLYNAQNNNTFNQVVIISEINYIDLSIKENVEDNKMSSARNSEITDKYGFVTTESCGIKLGKQIRLTEKKHNQFGYYKEGSVLTISDFHEKFGYCAGILIDVKSEYPITSIDSARPTYKNIVTIGWDGFEFID